MTISLTLYQILDSRKLKSDDINPNYPIWKLRINDEEYEAIKTLLREKEHNLKEYGLEAMIFYAEWWKRDYKDGIPSKKDAAKVIGFTSEKSTNKLFEVAKQRLEAKNYHILRKSGGKNDLSFRTLLFQGGLQLNYIKKNLDNPQSHIVAFFKALVKALAEDETFRNEALEKALAEDEASRNDAEQDKYEVVNERVNRIGKEVKLTSETIDLLGEMALKTALGVVLEDEEWFPFDDKTNELGELMRELHHENNRSTPRKQELSLIWQWKCGADAPLRVLLCAPKQLPAHLICDENGTRLDHETCNSFRLVVDGQEVAKYEYSSDLSGKEKKPIYHLISDIRPAKVTTQTQQSMVEVVARGDNRQRITLQVPGNLLPDFSYPQVWTGTDQEGLYQTKGKKESAKKLLLFDAEEWEVADSTCANVGETKIGAIEFSERIVLRRRDSGEEEPFENQFTPYKVSIWGSYLPWIEQSSALLLTSRPDIRVYDEEGNRVSKQAYTCFFRQEPQSTQARNNDEWKPLTRQSILPLGRLGFKVIFPDQHEEIVHAYSIGDLRFETQKADTRRIDLAVLGGGELVVKPLEQEGMKATPTGEGESRRWCIESNNPNTRPATCTFEISYPGHRPVKVSIPLQFKGRLLAHIDGRTVAPESILSLYNLMNFKLHNNETAFNLSLRSSSLADDQKASHRPERQGNTMGDQLKALGNEQAPDTQEVNLRISQNTDREEVSCVPFAQGTSSLDEVCKGEILHALHSVKTFLFKKFLWFSLWNRIYYILPYTLCTKQREDGRIEVTCRYANTFDKTYTSHLYALPVDFDLIPELIQAYPLDACEEGTNLFSFPTGFPGKECIVFSGRGDSHKVLPRYFNLNTKLNDEERQNIRQRRQESLRSSLLEQTFNGQRWDEACRVYSIFAEYLVPYSTHISLECIARDKGLLCKFIVAMHSRGKTVELLRENGLNLLAPDIFKDEPETPREQSWRNQLSQLCENIKNPEDLLNSLRKLLGVIDTPSA